MDSRLAFALIARVSRKALAIKAVKGRSSSSTCQRASSGPLRRRVLCDLNACPALQKVRERQCGMAVKAVRETGTATSVRG